MKKNRKNLSFYLIVLLFLIIFFISFSPRDRITNLNSCEGDHNKNEKSVTTIVYKDGSTDFFTDYCTSNVLYEFYCFSPNEMRTERLFCPGGCIDGMCFNSKEERLSILGLAPKTPPQSIGLAPDTPTTPGSRDIPSGSSSRTPSSAPQSSQEIDPLSLQEGIAADFFTTSSTETRDETLKNYITGVTQDVLKTVPAGERVIVKATEEDKRITISFYDTKDPKRVKSRLLLSGKGIELIIEDNPNA